MNINFTAVQNLVYYENQLSLDSAVQLMESILAPRLVPYLVSTY